MNSKSIVRVGMDVHQETIRIAVIGNGEQSSGEIFWEETLPNDRGKVVKAFRKLEKRFGQLECCYEAGGCGYVLQRQLQEMGIECQVIAPSLIPKAPGDRIKTDRRDARKLAKLFWNDQLTFVHIPNEEEESVRSLVRCREAKVEDLKRVKNRLLKFLQARGLFYREGTYWTQKHQRWLAALKLKGCDRIVFEQHRGQLEFLQEQLRELNTEIEKVAFSELYKEKVERLRCLKGIDTVTAITLVVEVVDFQRFGTAPELMSYFGLTPSENSSGGKIRRGGITKAGNRRVRRLLVESSWHYRHRRNTSRALQARRKGQSPRVIAHCQKAERRLSKRFRELADRKDRRQTVVAVARELTGFIWALMQPDSYLESQPIL
ncbi:MAG: IS110 family transposase [Candidatus Omnitrophica bacterium]|nr:IS110 family transposase [Candidatus Omnitrophota bacterium]